MNRSRVLILFLLLSEASLTSHASGAPSAEDHLIRVPKNNQMDDAYDRLWREKLFVTPGNISRFVALPGNVGTETVASVYRAPDKNGSLAGGYWLTVTQSSEALWNYFARPTPKGLGDPRSVKVVRIDAPLSQATALLIQRSWRIMLTQAKAERKVQGIPMDNSKELFSAEFGDGLTSVGTLPTVPKTLPRDTRTLLDIANYLVAYPDATIAGRATLNQKINIAAAALIKRRSR